MGYEIVEVNENTWRIEDGGHVRFFLLTGKEKALMIDSGMNVENVKKIAQSLTDLPIELLITHGDRDHTGGNSEFDTFYMNSAEASNYFAGHTGCGDYIPVDDKDIIDLGGRPLEIISLAGHTPGSIAVLDINGKMLFSGDPIQDGTIFMFGVQREYHAYLKSLRKLDRYRDRFDIIFPSHGSAEVKPELIDKLYDAMLDIKAGKYVPETANFHGTEVNCYDVGIAKFLLDK